MEQVTMSRPTYRRPSTASRIGSVFAFLGVGVVSLAVIAFQIAVVVFPLYLAYLLVSWLVTK